MDFGVVGLDGLVGSDIGFASSSSASDPLTKQIKLYGSSSTSLFQKHERSVSTVEDDWRSSKMAKTNDDFTASKGMPFLEQQQQQQQMLCFSSPKSDSSVPHNYRSSPAWNRSSGNNYGSMSYGGGGAHAASSVTGVKGPFSPSQWMELEHQALIFKYITANAPIPSNLLIPIINRKALESAALSSFSGQFFRPNNSLGWGPFHVGFSNNNDPEPGRCRRTDGKKWRCSRDAVSDQKYCERHLNRGRHRSRKPVEGRQAGHSVASGPTTITSASKLIPASSASTMVGPGSATASNNLPPITNPNHHHEQFKNMHRMFLMEENNDMKSRLNISHPFSIQKQKIPYDWPSSHKTESQNPLHQFFNNWPNSDTRSDSSQLSISLPMASSPQAEEKLALSPLRLASNVSNESNEKQGANWIPISWGASSSSMGGPLGEVLHPTSTTNNNSPSLGSSPTGVLQRTAFGSLSNSSAGSSPRPDIVNISKIS